MHLSHDSHEHLAQVKFTPGTDLINTRHIHSYNSTIFITGLSLSRVRHMFNALDMQSGLPITGLIHTFKHVTILSLVSNMPALFYHKETFRNINDSPCLFVLLLLLPEPNDESG
ncbi:hypothetical protein ILYODFUR_032484, partial [Ilyodon furcidens]